MGEVEKLLLDVDKNLNNNGGHSVWRASDVRKLASIVAIYHVYLKKVAGSSGHFAKLTRTIIEHANEITRDSKENQ